MKNLNTINIAGTIVQHSLSEDINKDGAPVIKGNITLQVDKEGTQVSVPCYASETFPNGDSNPMYGLLLNIMGAEENNNNNYYSVFGEVDVNYFVGRDGELAKSQRVPMRLKAAKKREFENKFKVDYLITNIIERPEDPEKGYKREAVLHGYIVNSKNVKEGSTWVKNPEKLVDFSVTAVNPKAIDYVLGLQASETEPYFVSTWGSFAEKTFSVTTENAFGDAVVEDFTRTFWRLDGMSPEPYEFGSEIHMDKETYDKLKAALEDFKEEKTSGGDFVDSAAKEQTKKLAF